MNKKIIRNMIFLLLLGFGGLKAISVNAATSIKDQYNFSSAIAVDKTTIDKSTCDKSDELLNYEATSVMTDELADTLVNGYTLCNLNPAYVSAGVCKNILKNANFTITVNYDSDLVTDFSKITFTSSFLEMTDKDTTTPGKLLITTNLKPETDFSTFTKSDWQSPMKLSGAAAVLSSDKFFERVDSNNILIASGDIHGTVDFSLGLVQKTVQIDSVDAGSVTTVLNKITENCASEEETEVVPDNNVEEDKPIPTNPNTSTSSIMVLSLVLLIVSTSGYVYYTVKSR